jgi:hypothetical protein
MNIDHDVEVGNVSPEFAALWDQQMLDYPTITRDEAGEWHYFAVTPVPHEEGESEHDVD